MTLTRSGWFLLIVIMGLIAMGLIFAATAEPKDTDVKPVFEDSFGQ